MYAVLKGRITKGRRIRTQSGPLHLTLVRLPAPDEYTSPQTVDLRKIIGASAPGHLAAQNPGGDDVVMVTYTYRDGVAWEPKHISATIQAMRDWFRRQGVPFRYVWVAELQPARGVLHYHAAYFVPRGFKLPFADERGWWPHGLTRTELARDAVAYLMSYLGKEDQKDFARFPKGARAYGVGGLRRHSSASIGGCARRRSCAACPRSMTRGAGLRMAARSSTSPARRSGTPGRPARWGRRVRSSEVGSRQAA